MAIQIKENSDWYLHCRADEQSYRMSRSVYIIWKRGSINDSVLLIEFAKAVQIFIRNVSGEQLSVALDVVKSIRKILYSSDELVIRIMLYNNVTFFVDEGFNERKSNP